jgi:hypothetical protein
MFYFIKIIKWLCIYLTIKKEMTLINIIVTSYVDLSTVGIQTSENKLLYSFFKFLYQDYF